MLPHAGHSAGPRSAGHRAFPPATRRRRARALGNSTPNGPSNLTMRRFSPPQLSLYYGTGPTVGFRPKSINSFRNLTGTLTSPPRLLTTPCFDVRANDKCVIGYPGPLFRRRLDEAGSIFGYTYDDVDRRSFTPEKRQDQPIASSGNVRQEYHREKVPRTRWRQATPSGGLMRAGSRLVEFRQEGAHVGKRSRPDLCNVARAVRRPPSQAGTWPQS